MTVSRRLVSQAARLINLTPNQPHKLYIHEQEPKYRLSLLPTNNTLAVIGSSRSCDPAVIGRSFEENPAFVTLLHQTILGSPAQLEYLFHGRAKQVGDGWIPLIDGRATVAFGRVPDSDDIIGMVRVENKTVLSSSYTPMPTHRLISPSGLFTLPSVLYEALMKQIV